MRRLVLLVVAVALAVSVFAPVAAARSDDVGADDRGMDDNATASPVSSAPATSSAMSTASGSATANATSSASPSSELPDTGGISFVPMLLATVLALLIGFGVVATVLVRRAS